jgi:hypothetical protein
VVLEVLPERELRPQKSGGKWVMPTATILWSVPFGRVVIDGCAVGISCRFEIIRLAALENKSDLLRGKANRQMKLGELPDKA